MKYHSRKSTRMQNFDYSSTHYYFITCCTDGKQCVFGTVNKLNEFGMIAKTEMENLAMHYEGVHVENFIIMPNHIRAIIALDADKNKHSLYEIVGLYKSGVSRKIRKTVPNMQVWQRSFHDHVIRNYADYKNIWNYVEYNDQKWKEDCYYPQSNPEQ